MGLLDISLPTCDTYSDLALVVRLFGYALPLYGCAFLVPFFVNYLTNFCDWFKNREKETRLAFLAVLVNAYPQYKGNWHFLEFFMGFFSD